MSPQRHDSDCHESGRVAAYVLRALGDEEAERYRVHLDGCAACSAEVARLQPIADALPSSPPRIAASDALRERIMSVVRAEAELLRAAGAADRPALLRPAPLRPRRRGRPLQLLSAAVAFGVGVLLGAVLIDKGSEAPPGRVIAAQLSSTSPGARAVLRQVGNHAELIVFSLPQPPRGKIYEIWLAPAKASPLPTDALFGVTHGGSASVDVPGNLAGVRQVLVTAEPFGGSAHPTSSPIIVATLRSS
jgi:anti-sigma-K factor RskA